MLNAYQLLVWFTLLCSIHEGLFVPQPTSGEAKSYRVSIVPLTRTIELNAPYYAECRVEPQPRDHIEFAWYFNGRFHSEGQRLNIPELNEHTIGEYTCQANIHTSSGTPLVAQARAIIQYQPGSLEQPDLETYLVSIVPLTPRIERRAPYYAECHIQPRPRYPVRYTWYYKGRYHSEGQRLRISQLNDLTAGKYTCQATIEMPSGAQSVSNGTGNVDYTSTLPDGSVHGQVSIFPLTQQMEHNQPFNAECRIEPPPTVPADYTWYFQDRVFSRGQRLSIPKLTADSAGDYTCEARFRSMVGSTVEGNATITLRYTSSRPVRNPAPQTYWVSINPLTETPARGSPYYADCRLQPQPPYPVRLTWYFKGRYHSEGQRLSIRELNEYTTGEYTCQATISTPTGTPLTINASRSIHYAAAPPPDVAGRIQANIVPLTQQVERKRPFYAECRLSPRPSVPVDYTWYFQGRVFSRGERLSIPELNEYTVGDYICKARFRPAGDSTVEITATISLWFESAPSGGSSVHQQTYAVSIESLTQQPSQRAPYYAECRIQPRPPYPIRFTWYFKGRYHSDDQRLRIPELNDYTTGEYTCQVTVTPPTGSPLVANATRSIYYRPVLPHDGAGHQTYRVSIEPLTQRIEHRAPYSAECRVQPTPRYPVRFTWYFKGRYYSQGERLNIPELNEYTSGEYTCQAALEQPSGSPLLVNATRTVYYRSASPTDSGEFVVSIVRLTQQMEHRRPFYAECRLSPRPSVPVDYTWYFQGRVFSRGERLSIPELNENSVGDYTCQARFRPKGGSTVEGKATISLRYNYIPSDALTDPQIYRVSINPLAESPARGSSFYADCRLQPQPPHPVRLTWYFKGRYHSEGQRLSIPELNEDTVGDYTCQATITSPTGGPLTVNVTKPIYFATEPSPDPARQFVVRIVRLTQQMEHRRPFYADCRLSPRPSAPVDYTWYFQGRVFSRGERLRIPELNDYTVGDYTCQVRFRQAGGSTIEGKAIISLQYNSFPSDALTDPQTYRVSINPLIERPARGAPFYADCRLQPQPPHPVRLTWYFKGRYHSEGQRLSIHELNENTIGEYTCQATITTPTGTPMTVNATVPIYYAAAPSPDPAGQFEVRIVPLTQQMEHRRPFYADCRLSPRPSAPVDYTWYFQGRVFSRGERLRIPEINDYTIGDYTCEVRFMPTSGSTIEGKATISLRYNSLPSDALPDSKTYRVSISTLTERPARGSPFYADCRLQPQPPHPVRLTWYFKGRYHSEGQRLSIRELNEYTIGDYTCQATITTPTGGPLTVNVTKPIYFATAHSPESAGQFELSIVRLTPQMEHRRPFYADCHLSPRPSVPVDYTWYFQDRVFSRGERLRIPELNDNTIGDYTCQVRFRPAGGSTIERMAKISLRYNLSPSDGRTDPQTYWVSINPLTERPARGSPFYADCRLQPQPPHPVRLTWYFKGRYHSEGQRLSIPELNEYTVGDYTCQATITTPTGGPLTVNVTKTIFFPAAPSPDILGRIQVNIVPLTQHMEYKRPFYANCRLTPRPSVPVEYTWYFQGRAVSRGERLSIPELNEHTVGDYTCEVVFKPTSGSTVEAKATISLQYHSPPSNGPIDNQTYWVIIDPLTGRPAQNAAYYADCRIQPRPPYPLRFAWYFKGRYHSDGQRLRIPELNDHTTGEYTCQVTITPPTGSPQVANATKAIYYGSVLPPAGADDQTYWVSIEPLTQRMEHRAPYSAECRVQPRPRYPVRFTWYFKGRYHSQGERLNIPELNEYTSGDYTCQAAIDRASGSPLRVNATRPIYYRNALPGRMQLSIVSLTQKMEYRKPFYAECQLTPRPNVPVDYTWFLQGRVFAHGERLSIPELDEKTVGDYMCQARFKPEGGSYVEMKATLSLWYTPPSADCCIDPQTYGLSINPLTERPARGSAYYADCRLQPEPLSAARFTWYFKGHYHSEGHRLSIHDLNENTVGEYTCQATITTPTGPPLTINATRSVYYAGVPSPAAPGPGPEPAPVRPQVSIAPLTQQMQYRRPFYADCRLSPRPNVPVHYTWYFEGQVYSRGERLSIRELNEHTMGDYTCQARFRPADGSTVETTASISLRYTPPLSAIRDAPVKPKVSIDRLTKRMEYQKPFYADCRVSPPQPNPVQYTWYFQDQVYSRGERLRIPELNERTVGNYTCQIQIMPTMGPPVDAAQSLLVNYNQPVSADIQSDQQDYSVRIEPLTPNPQYRSRYYAECHISPQPPQPVHFAWYYRGRLYSEDKRLVIDQLNEYNTGEYTCRATISNRLHAPIDANATITVGYSRTPPGRPDQQDYSVRIEPLTPNPQYRSRYYAECHISPQPPQPVHFAWYYRGRLYSEDKRLVIDQLNEYNTGEYTCRATISNRLHAPIDANATITVGYSRTPPGRPDSEGIRVIVQPLTREMAYKKPFQAVCRLTPPTTNPIQFTWYFKDRVFTHGERLMVSEVNEDSIGEYICRARVLLPSGQWQESHTTLDLQYRSPRPGDYAGCNRKKRVLISGTQSTRPTSKFSATLAPLKGPQLLVRHASMHLVRNGPCCQRKLPIPATGDHTG